MFTNKVFIELNNCVNNFVKQFFEDYQAEIGLEFECFLDDCLIQYAIVATEKEEEEFYNNFVKRFPRAKNFSTFTLSVLHEIGHLETEDIMIDDTEIRNKPLTNKQYFNLYNEKIATNWAGRWINENFEEAKKINETFIKLLDNVYNFIKNA